MRITRVGPVMVVLGLATPGCDDGVESRGGDALRPDQAPLPDEDSTPDVEPLEMNAGFDAAAEEFDVPVALLQTIAYAETGWQMVVGEPEFDGRPIAYGVISISELENRIIRLLLREPGQMTYSVYNAGGRPQ